MNSGARLLCFLFPLWRAWGRVALGLVLLLAMIPEAMAVFTFSSLATKRSITLQVGASTAGTVNSVTFDVSNASVSPSPVSVTGVPDNAAATSPSGGILIRLKAGIVVSDTRVTLTVDSSPGLSCIGGSGCGTTIIPFNTISWTAYNHDTTYPSSDIQDGTFNGSSSQGLTDYFVRGGGVEMSNVLIFKYANTMLYPAGKYSGRVTYTATMP